MKRTKRGMAQVITLFIAMMLVPMIAGSGSSSIASATTVSIGDLTCDDGGTVTAEVMLKDVQNYGTGTINIAYNPTIVHVTGVAGNTNSTLVTHNEDNTAGVVTISAWNTGGVSGDIAFASVTFKAVGTGSTPLGLDVTKLRDTSMTTPIPFEVANGSITVSGGNAGTGPQLPFVIDGHVTGSDGNPCSSLSVKITNANTGASWDAGTNAGSSYYVLVLGMPADINSGDVLQFSVTCGSDSSTTDRTIATDDIAAGGIFNFDISFAQGDSSPTLVTYTISNSTISPNGDGVMDDTAIDVEFSESVAAAIKIENATGVITTLYTSASVIDPAPQVWNGTDDSGNTVTYGTYQVNVTMDDGVNPVVFDNTRSIIVADTSVAVISIGDGVGNVTLPIKIENGLDIGACDITLTFDPAVVNVTNVTGGDMDITVANLEHVHEGLVRIGTYQGGNPGLSGEITFAKVVFEPINGGNCSLNLSVVTFKDATPVGNQMPYIIRNGTYTGGVAMNGDVNGDSMVDIHDAMYLAKHLLGKVGFDTIDKEAADVNGDGEISTHDAMYIAKHVIGASGYEVLK